MELWSLVAAPLLVGTLLLVAGRRANRIAPFLGIGCGVVVAALAVASAIGRPSVNAPMLTGIPVSLAVDELSAVMVVTVAGVLLAVLIYSAGEFGADEPRARFFGLMLVFAGAMLVTVTATNLLVLLMAWEVMGATSYALIGFWWRDEHRVNSGNIAFLTTRTADLGLYLAAGAMLAGGAGGLALADLAQLLPGWRDAATAGIVVAALGKSAQLPFSFWLSRAMDGPSPVSALLHSATMVAAGAYLLLRIQPTGWAGVVVAWVGALTALLLGAVALVQRDLKQVLAASTCSQVGFMVLAAGTGGTTAGTGQLVAHAATKSLLFLCAGAWLAALGTKDLARLRGAARGDRVVGMSFAVGALALAGMPPLSIWITKDAVLSAALHESVPLYLTGLAAALVSAGYAGRVLMLTWSGAAPDGKTLSWQHKAPLPFLAAGAALLGFEWLSGAVWWELVLSGSVAVAGIAVTTAVVRRQDALAGRGRVLNRWLGLEFVAQRWVARPVFGLARLLARFDDRMIAGRVDRGAAAAVGLSGVLARFDDRVVDGGVRATAAIGSTVARMSEVRVEFSLERLVRAVTDGVRRLGRLARRPQTGQLHHYYAQAVVILVVLTALLIVTGLR
ncbi:proton-conducting transporter membrane subunit [Lentzea sp. NPDC005914]|uniref:NADH-quinone oxidoreductase subunit 5 family protein n=1 Tax=Lentzea sp. NPDC005914 TaxID=3154572 RepID=UPI0033FEB522